MLQQIVKVQIKQEPDFGCGFSIVDFLTTSTKDICSYHGHDNCGLGIQLSCQTLRGNGHSSSREEDKTLYMI